jgi:phosphatidylserine/phosphatidylglycerophosphate/cardiolipin synthase-like enzyme
VSPDAGLVTLEGFLKATKNSLVIGMYDFTSATLLKDFEVDLGTPRTLQMVLDNPALNPTANQSDWQTVQELQHSLGNRAEIVRALTRSDAFAAQWMFPSAYHIKVIVRDNTSFWLSSGNLNNSNEPDHANPPTTEDRDWHVIIEDAGLAQTFAAFIKQDYASAAAHQAANPDEVEVEIERAHAKTAAEKNPPPPRKSVSVTHKDAGQQLAPQTFSNVDVSITPLLTPDKLPGTQTGQYVTNITGLIKSAQHTLYIQLQYIESSSGSGDYNALLQTIAERVQAGVKVCLIQNTEYGQKWGEKMKSAGVDLTANIRLQPSVHNKGFVVDSQTVVVSSQNFSPQGIEQNRDAGVIIANAEVAGYFEKVFLADWNIAKPFVAHASAATGKGKPAKNAPAKKSSAKKAAKKASAKKATKKAAAKKAAKKTLHKNAATKKAAKKTAKKSRAHAKKPS